MKTTLIAGEQAAPFDAILLSMLRLSPARAHITWRQPLLIGIAGEHGRVYRVIGVEQLAEFIAVIRTLRCLGYTDETDGDHAFIHDFHDYDALVRPCKRR